MRRFLTIIGLAVLTSLPSFSQQTSLVATKIAKDSSGAPLAEGRLCLTPVLNGKVTGYQLGDAQVLPTQLCIPVVNGAIAPTSIADTAVMQPAGIGYNVKVTDAHGAALYTFPAPVYVTGATYDLGTWVGPQITPAPLTAISQASQAPTGPCAGAQVRYVSIAGTTSLYSCTLGQWVSVSGSGSGGAQADWTATTGPSVILHKPSLSSVALSGAYADLTGKPTIPAAQINSDWLASSGIAQILNKPALAPVATSGAYGDLSGVPALAPVATTGTYSSLTGTPALASVATSGLYSDLTGKPSLATVATTGSYTDLLNKPTIPSGTVTSVAVTAPSDFTVSGSPITSNGTIAITAKTQAANTIKAGPASGAAAAPTYRTLVPADLPVATTGQLGAVQPDGTTVTINNGVISANAALPSTGLASGSATKTITGPSIIAPVVSAPSTATTGGALAAAAYYYKVTSLTAGGESTGSTEVSIATTGTTSANTITWAAATGATGYKVYRGTAANTESVYFSVGNVTSYTDTGSGSSNGTVPTANTTLSIGNTTFLTPTQPGTYLISVQAYVNTASTSVGTIKAGLSYIVTSAGSTYAGGSVANLNSLSSLSQTSFVTHLMANQPLQYSVQVGSSPDGTPSYTAVATATYLGAY